MMALAAMLVTAGFTACSSDDDNNNTPAPEPEKVTEIEVTGQFAFPWQEGDYDTSQEYNFFAMNEDGEKGYLTYKGHQVGIGIWSTKIFSVKGSNGKSFTMRCFAARLGYKKFTSFPATYSFTVYTKMWQDLNEAVEADVYDYFVAPYFTVRTNLDENAKAVLPGDPGYTYYPKVSYLEIKNNPALLEKYEGKYICTLNIDKDGNCTATQKFEKLTAADKEMLDAATGKSDK